MQLHGEIRFPEVVRPVFGAVLYIRLLDVSKADAAAEIVAEDVIEDVSFAASEHQIGFVLEVGDLHPRQTYAVEAHLDVDHSGDVSSGDYRTMEHFGVSPATAELQRPVVCRPIR